MLIIDTEHYSIKNLDAVFRENVSNLLTYNSQVSLLSETCSVPGYKTINQTSIQVASPEY